MCEKESEEEEILERFPCARSNCTNMATKKCSRCRAIHYCSKPCSDANWKNHKKNCKRITTGPFRIQEMPGKGEGMVATRVLFPGDIVVTEEPLIVIKDGEPIRIILSMFDALSEEDKNVLLSLYDPGVNPQNDIQGVTDEKHQKFIRITWANSMQLCGYPELGVDGLGVYATISRINHSCAPNAIRTWLRGDNSKRSKQVRACQRIDEGEEICFSYIKLDSSFLLREKRQMLLRNWFPSCRCVICHHNDEKLATSEQNRVEMVKLHQNMKENCKQGRLREAAHAALQKIQTMEKCPDEFIHQIPCTLLDYYELATILRRREGRLDGETPEDFRERAFIMATEFGDSSIFQYEKKLRRISRLVL